MKKNLLLSIPFLLTAVAVTSCHSSAPNTTEEAAEVPETPVTVVAVSTGEMSEYVELNATAVFQQKWIVKSNVNGYIQDANVQLNRFVSSGQRLFTVKTKEAQSIGNTINILDSSFKFNGINHISSNGNGFLSEINHQSGDYVQDGEQLAVVTDSKSFVFLLDLPYEMRPYMVGKSSVPLLLPDGEQLVGRVSGNMPVMDSAGQTQRIILKVITSHPLPENLIAKVRLTKRMSNTAAYVPRSTILTDETQSDFWVMKMINDSTAVKVPIKKGIESGNNVEIISPVFSASDKIILTGNYALADTARVKVMKTPAAEQ